MYHPWNESVPFHPHPLVPPFALPVSPPRGSLSPPRVLSPVEQIRVRALSPPRRRGVEPEVNNQHLMAAETRWLQEEDRIRAGLMVPHVPQRRVIRSAMPEELAPLPREVDKHDEAMMMARWAQLVEARVETTERSLAAATQVAAEAGRDMRMRESLAEREKELAHENMLRDVENAKASAESERRAAFHGRVFTTKLEQEQAEQLSQQREYFERDMLEREKRYRDAQAHRRDAEEAWRLRRKEREDDQRETERIARAGAHKEKAQQDLSRAEDLERVARALDQAQRAREHALAVREEQRDDQRRQRMRREAELEAATREEAELADNMISNMDRQYREQEQAAAALREREAREVDLGKLEAESKTRAPFRAARATEHLKLLSACEREVMESAERDAFALQMTEEDMERRIRASYRIQRGLDQAVDMSDGAARQLRGVDMRGMHGGPLAHQSDTMNRRKLGTVARDEQQAVRLQQHEANKLANHYSDHECSLEDAAGMTRPGPEHTHIHHGEEYDYSFTAAGAAGPVPTQDRALHYGARPDGRLMANVLGPREEMEVAREAKMALEKQTELTQIEAARSRCEEAEFNYSARKVQYAQLQARHEQYLGEATPALAAAQAAAGALVPESLSELHHTPDPTPAVRATVIATHMLLTRGTGQPTYEAARQRLMYSEQMIEELRSFDCDQLPESVLEKVSNMMRTLDVDEVLTQSPVSGTLLLWVANVARFNEVYRLVRPVRVEMQKAAMAMEESDEARRAAAKKLSYSLAWRE